MSNAEPTASRGGQVAPDRRDAARVLAEAGPTVSIREAAVILGCSRDLVYAMHSRGDLADLGIRVLRLGSRLRISTASLRRVVEHEPARSRAGHSKPYPDGGFSPPANDHDLRARTDRRSAPLPAPRSALPSERLVEDWRG